MNDQEVITVDGWKIDASSYLIVRDGVERKLEPRTMALLLFLVEHRGQVVSRFDIEDNVWRDRVVGYDSLSRAVSKLRSAFDDTARTHRVIKTIPKGGYQLVAKVEFGTSEESVPVAEARGRDIEHGLGDTPSAKDEMPVGMYVVTPDPRSSQSSNKPLVVGISAGAIGLLIGAAIMLQSTSREATETAPSASALPNPNVNSIAVLPFTNLSNDPGQTVYADGLTDDLITDLANVPELAIRSRHLSFNYRDSNLPMAELGSRLKARYILKGSLRQSLDDIRVNVQLVDSINSQEVWAQRFDDKFENLLSLQDQIIEQVLAFFDLEAPEKPASRRRTKNLEAYDYFLRAEHRRLNSRGIGGSQRILEFYRRAIDLDPNFIGAYIGLAREALSNWQQGDDAVMPLKNWRKLVYENAGKTLELEPNNAEAMAILGLIQTVSGSHDVGLASVRKAIERDPENPQLQADYAAALSYAGQHEEALHWLDRAIAALSKPPDAYFRERARINFFLGRFESAALDSERSHDAHSSRDFSAFIHGAMGNREQARRYARERLQRWPHENLGYYRLMFAYYRRSGDIDQIVNAAEVAGLPRFAFGFEPGSDPLDDNQILHLARSGSWLGNLQDGRELVKSFANDRDVVVRGPGEFFAGRFKVENSHFCVEFETGPDSLHECGPIFQSGPDDRYVWIRPDDLYRFSTIR